MKRIWKRVCVLGVMLGAIVASGFAQDVKTLPVPDERYKLDILLVVAHPDDEAAATAYLARAMDEGKRAGVVYGTRGSSGANDVGPEQAAALGDIRVIEARRALATLGIMNVWFVGGHDTASQDVLQSLSSWDHGKVLEEMVRLVRLTRPEVVLTFLPGTFIGEDHGDHQAAGVLATEAFDLAGDPLVFPEQVTGPMRRLEPYFDNLRAWQPKKIYYFPDASREDIFKGKGPTVSVTGISKTTKQPYWRMALEAFRAHETQAKAYIDSFSKMDEAALEKKAQENGWSQPQEFVLGKSLVGGSVTGDIFEGITPGAIPFARTNQAPAPAQPDVAQPDLGIELAGPWGFYAEFRRAHGLENLPHPEPPEIALQAGTTLVVPLWIRNQTGAAQEIALSVGLPAGWKVESGDGKVLVAAKQVAAARVEINLPMLADANKKKQEAQEVTVRGEVNGKTIGAVKLRVELRKKALPE
ncbi:MAG TPA: PIG-L family deacetylase [Candidatus Acidoferrum sp.]|nr:PIG-L family deacetylase [Candidatus Acidoferrum sp.]